MSPLGLEPRSTPYEGGAKPDSAKGSYYQFHTIQDSTIAANATITENMNPIG